MALRILTNIPSLTAQRNLDIAQRALTKALERLSSGIRINRAADDPAGFLVSILMDFQVKGVDVGTNNLLMAVDLLNTADAYVRTISENLTRMEELAFLAHNSLLSDAQRAAYNLEFQERIIEIQRLASNAAYMGKALLTGSLVGSIIQTGPSLVDVVTISIETLTTGACGLNISGLSISTMSSASQVIFTMPTTINTYFGPRIANIAAQASAWLSSSDAQKALLEALKAGKSRIWDADLAAETTNLTNAQVIVQSGIAALAQANAAQTLALGLIGMGR